MFNLREEWRAPATVGVVAFAGGFGVGYFVCQRRNKTVTWSLERNTIETVEVDEPNPQLKLDFERAAQEAKHPVVEDVELPQEDAEVIEFPDPEPEIQPEDESWNQEEEEADRGPDAPYVIHKDEFWSGETGFAQSSLEYFAADEVLCDDQRVPIYNASHIVGKLEFGHGSGDSDVVFIRNESLKAEYEITRNHGSYQIEVLGLEAEEEAEETDLRHSNNVLKFRD